MFTFENPVTGEKPIDIAIGFTLWRSPKTIMYDNTLNLKYKDIDYSRKRSMSISNRFCRLRRSPVKTGSQTRLTGL